MGALMLASSDDADAETGSRKSTFAEMVTKKLSEHGLAISPGLSYVIVEELESIGVISSQGRNMELDSSKLESMRASGLHHGQSLRPFQSQLSSLESLAQERADRRKKRQKARERDRNTKRKRL